jgi:hypothetical protein
MSHRRRVQRSATHGLILLQVDTTGTHFQIWSQRSQQEYLVTAEPGHMLFCECKDFEIRRQKCKHILFVLGRILGLSIDELNALDPSRQLGEGLCERLATAAAEFLNKRTRPQSRPVDDTCGICMEPFHAGSVVCDCYQCWHTCHHECLRLWHHAAQTHQQQQAHACPFCRRPFQNSLPYLLMPGDRNINVFGAYIAPLLNSTTVVDPRTTVGRPATILFPIEE